LRLPLGRAVGRLQPDSHKLKEGDKHLLMGGPSPRITLHSCASSPVIRVIRGGAWTPPPSLPRRRPIADEHYSPAEIPMPTSERVLHELSARETEVSVRIAKAKQSTTLL